MVMSASDQAELDQLRKSAALFITNPLEKAFFRLESLMESDRPNRVDSVMNSTAFNILANALLELKRELCKK
jgi:hypothetical protein